jgi:GAF domain-containing protein
MIDEGTLTAERLTLLYTLGQAFSSLMTLDTLLPSIITRTKEIMQAESCALLLLDEEHQEFYFPVTSDLSPTIEARMKNIRFPADKGEAGWVLQQRKPALVLDASRDDRFYMAVDRRTGEQTHELLCAPLRTHHGVIGVIELRNKLVGSFTEDDLAFLDALAGSVASRIRIRGPRPLLQ